MLFNSIEYLVFLPAVITVYFLVPPRFRWALLLVASYCFYMAWEPAYILLIVTSTLVDYLAGLFMGRTTSRAVRRRWLVASLTANLGLLFAFKYFNFFNASLRTGFELAGLSYSMPALNVLLPVGISFYTFQTLSYTIEVYRGNQKPERHLGYFALYVSFFPQLVAGPIERAGNLLPQLRKTRRFDYDNAVEGMRLILWGMFKKVVVADWLALFVDRVYDDPTRHPGPILALGTVAFAYQIYCDFSGYSDIAIGSARIMGIRLMTNFNRPYRAKSIPEFWQRWHISLSTWFRDYLYIPLGGNRVAVPRWCLNLVVVFGLSGLWHGANWTFLVWGLLHAAYYLASQATRGARARAADALGLSRLPRIHAAFQVVVTFALVCLAWVFFRADSVREAWYVVTHIATGWGDVLADPDMRYVARAVTISPMKLYVMLGSVLALILVERSQRDGSINSVVADRPVWIRWAAYIAVAMTIMNVGVTHEIPFVYFQF
jgi:alginate O-acetyltransferase complex protein AlgI